MSARPLPPPSSYAAAAVATVIGFGGTVALVVQAGQTMGATPAQIISMVTALCLGIGLGGLMLSWRFKIPVVLAWSTPGAALLAAYALDLSWPTAVGAFLIAGGLMVLTGLIPALGRLANRIPTSIASAMLAGVLLPFCLKLFSALTGDLWLGLGLLLVFLLMRRLAPNWTLPVVLVLAFAILGLGGQISLPSDTTLFGTLSLTAPQFDWRTAVSLSLPLYLVTLASQNLPGLVVLRAAGYTPPANRLIFWGGLASSLTAPFGAHGVNLAAITAALCTGPDAHPDAAKRWQVGVIYGLFYLVVALFAAPLAGLFIAMPANALAMITGLALIAPLVGALTSAFQPPEYGQAAALTFVATASGLSLFGIGSAFWGLLIGLIGLVILRGFHHAPVK